MLPGEARRRRRPRRRPTSEPRAGRRAAGPHLATSLDRVLLPGGDRLDDRRRRARRRAGPGRPSRIACPSPTAFEPKIASSRAFSSGTTSLHASTVTSPAVAVDAHARAVGDALGRLARPDDARDPVLARHDRRVREQAAAVGHDRAEQRQQDVERLGRRLGDEDVALDDPVELGGAGDEARRALRRRPGSPRARAAGPPRAPPRSCRTARPSAIPVARIMRADAGRQPGRVRRGRRRRAEGRRSVLGAVRGAVLGPRRELVGGRPVRARTAARASPRGRRRSKCAGSWMRPLAASRRPAASTARRMSPEAQMSLNTPRSSRSR